MPSILTGPKYTCAIQGPGSRDIPIVSPAAPRSLSHQPQAGDALSAQAPPKPAPVKHAQMDEAAGKTRGAAGYTAGKPGTEAKGAAQTVKGKAQKTAGKARSTAKKKTR